MYPYKLAPLRRRAKITRICERKEVIWCDIMVGNVMKKD